MKASCEPDPWSARIHVKAYPPGDPGAIPGTRQDACNERTGPRQKYPATESTGPRPSGEPCDAGVVVVCTPDAVDERAPLPYDERLHSPWPGHRAQTRDLAAQRG
jgi:hypothetical protein